VLGSAVGGLIILTNARTLLRSDWLEAPGTTRAAWYAGVAIVWAACVAHSIRQHRASAAPSTAGPDDPTELALVLPTPP
jgi:hypothetical protein